MLKIGEYFGEKTEDLVATVFGAIIIACIIAVIVGVLCVPIAAIKYLFFA